MKKKRKAATDNNLVDQASFANQIATDVGAAVARAVIASRIIIKNGGICSFG